MWFAYLRRRGLITPDGRPVEEPPSLFVAEPTRPTAAAEEMKQEARLPSTEKDDLPLDDSAAG